MAPNLREAIVLYKTKTAKIVKLFNRARLNDISATKMHLRMSLVVDKILQRKLQG